MASTEYHLRTDWTFNAPLERAWDVVLDLEHYPAWWKDFRRVQRLKGDGQSVGSLFACEVRGALPYSLRYTIEVTRSEKYQTVELRSTGDLVGTGRWQFSSPQPSQTLATYFWDVSTSNPLLNLLAPLARALFARNHDQVMNRGYLALRRHLEG